MPLKPLSTDNSLRKLCLETYWSLESQTEGNKNEAIKVLMAGVAIFQHDAAEHFLLESIQMQKEERRIVESFYKISVLHFNFITESHRELRKCAEEIRNGAPVDNLRVNIWRNIGEILSNVNSIYHIFSPDIKKKRHLMIREHRGRVMRQAAGLHEPYFLDLKYLRDGHVHFDETMDELIALTKITGKPIVDLVLLNVDSVSASNSHVARSYDIENDILYFHNRRRCRLSALSTAFITFMTAINLNMSHPRTINSFPTYATMIPALLVD